ncbi:MAG: YihY/virulence factor BrkB family protein [Lachnospiraceae bacterium]|nr:YihY/virulence factor BrkB family protein [Lachnospiraceae bacterium]
MFKKIIRSLREFTASISRKNISAFSASTAFFLFLSLIPMLAVICAVLPYTPLTAKNLLFVIDGYVLDTVNPMVRVIVEDVYSRSAGILSIAIVGTLWSAGKGMLALIRGLNVINGVEEDRNYFVLRAVASFYTLIMIIVIILSLFLMVFGNILINLFLRDFPQVLPLFEMLMHFRFVFSWMVLTLVFTMIYTFVPNRKMRFREQLTGGMFAAVVWSVFSWCFSMYVDCYEGFGTYGSLATIVIIMLYLYFCMYIILIGAYINSYLKKKGGVKRHWEEIKENKT